MVYILQNYKALNKYIIYYIYIYNYIHVLVFFYITHNCNKSKGQSHGNSQQYLKKRLFRTIA